MEKNPGTRLVGSNIVLPPKIPTYKELGIEKMESHRWQKIASIPDGVIPTIVAIPTGA
jgi:hypothetical protein